MEQECRGREGFSQAGSKDRCPAWGSQFFLCFLLVTTFMCFHIKTPNWWNFSVTLMPYERKAQLGRAHRTGGENDRSAFFLAQPFRGPWWSSSKWNDSGPDSVFWLVFSWKTHQISCNPLTALEQVKGKLGFNNQHAVAAATSRRAFLKELWDNAVGVAMGGEETNPKEFGQCPRALTSIGNGLLRRSSQLCFAFWAPQHRDGADKSERTAARMIKGLKDWLIREED